MGKKSCWNCGRQGCWWCGWTGTTYVPDDDEPRPPRGSRGGDSSIGGFLVLGIIGFVAYAVIADKQAGPGSSRSEPAQGASVNDKNEAGSKPSLSLEIEKAGDIYSYYDMEFMKTYGPNAKGYTLSRTPPYEEVEFIEEQGTYYQTNMFDNGKRVSWGRRIPRNQVRPIRHTPGNSIGSQRARSFYYTPPSTASDWELKNGK